MTTDRESALRFLQTAFAPDDWVAVMLKAHHEPRVAQRILPVSVAASDRVQAWLARENDAGRCVYLSVNPIRPGRISRSRHTVAAVRHVFVDVDRDAAQTVASLTERTLLPPVSYVVWSSTNRAHLLWRVAGFSRCAVELLQRHLARELRADPAATSCAQLTRWPGFGNHKYADGPGVTVEYRDVVRVYGPENFPRPRAAPAIVRWHDRGHATDGDPRVALRRARRYLATVPPAVAGQHGDLRTYQVACRLVRGFGLTDDEAERALSAWNAQCRPPWNAPALREKLRHARRYGREPVRGLLDARGTRSRSASV